MDDVLHRIVTSGTQAILDQQRAERARIERLRVIRPERNDEENLARAAVKRERRRLKRLRVH